MKILNLIIIMTMISGLSFGQNQVSTDFNIDYLTGTWKNITEFRSETLTYTKSDRIEKDYAGFIIKFTADRKVVSRNIVKSVRCGNDLSRIPRKGEWNFDKDTGILETTMLNRISGGRPIVKSYKILELNNNKLVMKLITE